MWSLVQQIALECGFCLVVFTTCEQMKAMIASCEESSWILWRQSISFIEPLPISSYLALYPLQEMKVKGGRMSGLAPLDRCSLSAGRNRNRAQRHSIAYR